MIDLHPLLENMFRMRFQVLTTAQLAEHVYDQDLLGEITKMVLETEQYREIASRETVYSIKQGVSRFNVSNPSSVFHYEIYVKTEKQTYIFTCTDKFCTNVSNGSWMYSRYSEEEPLLPLKKISE